MASKFKDGDLVWAKIKGHPPWPAFVDSRNGVKKSKVTVRFFGSDEVGFILPNNVFPYEKNKEKFAKSKKNKIFLQALAEIEHHATQLQSTEDIADVDEEFQSNPPDETQTDKQNTSTTKSVHEADNNAADNTQPNEHADDAITPLPDNVSVSVTKKSKESIPKLTIKRKAKSKAKTTSKKLKTTVYNESDDVEPPAEVTGEGKNSQFGLITSKMMDVVRKENQSRFDVSSDEEHPGDVKRSIKEDSEKKSKKNSQSATAGIKLKISIGTGTASVVTDNSGHTNGKEDDKNEGQKKVEKEKRKAEKLQQKIAKKEAEKEKRKQALKERKKKELLARKMEGKKQIKDESKERDSESNEPRNEMTRAKADMKSTLDSDKSVPQAKEVPTSITADSHLKRLSLSLRESMKVDSPDINRCLSILNDIEVTNLSAEAIVKNKDLILTIKKLRRYKANEEIMMKADNLYRQVKEVASRFIENSA
ncbi:PC4 and SFRS1-interacting protein [Trichoplax sp. H2]|nr:PC4 and SFRS1-interacting protein [Trichoplax sp. H2]|eukprot:RDD47623.1 PC4 and SFRS1-interacting protein [Trichoplax sp. H2]